MTALNFALAFGLGAFAAWIWREAREYREQESILDEINESPEGEIISVHVDASTDSGVCVHYFYENGSLQTVEDASEQEVREARVIQDRIISCLVSGG